MWAVNAVLQRKFEHTVDAATGGSLLSFQHFSLPLSGPQLVGHSPGASFKCIYIIYDGVVGSKNNFKSMRCGEAPYLVSLVFCLRWATAKGLENSKELVPYFEGHLAFLGECPHCNPEAMVRLFIHHTLTPVLSPPHVTENFIISFRSSLLYHQCTGLLQLSGNSWLPLFILEPAYVQWM